MNLAANALVPEAETRLRPLFSVLSKREETRLRAMAQVREELQTHDAAATGSGRSDQALLVPTQLRGGSTASSDQATEDESIAPTEPGVSPSEATFRAEFGTSPSGNARSAEAQLQDTAGNKDGNGAQPEGAAAMAALNHALRDRIMTAAVKDVAATDRSAVAGCDTKAVVIDRLRPGVIDQMLQSLIVLLQQGVSPMAKVDTAEEEYAVADSTRAPITPSSPGPDAAAEDGCSEEYTIDDSLNTSDTPCPCVAPVSAHLKHPARTQGTTAGPDDAAEDGCSEEGYTIGDSLNRSNTPCPSVAPVYQKRMMLPSRKQVPQLMTKARPTSRRLPSSLKSDEASGTTTGPCGPSETAVSAISDAQGAIGVPRTPKGSGVRRMPMAGALPGVPRHPLMATPDVAPPDAKPKPSHSRASAGSRSRSRNPRQRAGTCSSFSNGRSICNSSSSLSSLTRQQHHGVQAASMAQATPAAIRPSETNTRNSRRSF